MSINKDVLFYSNIDSYSINCLNVIIRNNVKQKFNYICVDGKTDQLPVIITKVPCILTTSKNIKIDNDVMDYIKEIINKIKNKSNNNENIIQDYLAGNDNCQFIDIEDHDNMDTNGENNTQLKSCSLLDEGFSLITQEAKDGKVVMGKKDANYSQNIDRKMPEAPITKPSQKSMMTQQPQVFMQNNGNNHHNLQNAQNNNFQQHMMQQRGPNMPQNMNAIDAISQQSMPSFQQHNQNDNSIKNINLDNLLAQRQADIQALTQK
jgi:hypothetical protein